MLQSDPSFPILPHLSRQPLPKCILRETFYTNRESSHKAFRGRARTQRWSRRESILACEKSFFPRRATARLGVTVKRERQCCWGRKARATLWRWTGCWNHGEKPEATKETHLLQGKVREREGNTCASPSPPSRQTSGLSLASPARKPGSKGGWEM